MTARVGDHGSQTIRLMQRLRDLTPAWTISQREARWIAERQARLLLAAARVTAPPVPTEIVNRLDGVTVYPLAHTPVKGLMGASKPNSHGGDILINSTLPSAERRMTLMHELKHIIDGGHATKLCQTGSQTSAEGLCTDFAMSVLMPAPWLQADWKERRRSLQALAERYQVPIEAVQQRLHALGLVKHPPRRAGRVACQWHPHTKNKNQALQTN